MTPLAFAVAAALGNVVGALAVVRHLRRGLRFIDTCLAFGAGFMLAVAVLGVLPEVFRSNSSTAGLYVLLGYLAVHLAQHVLTPHFHFGEETHRLSPSAGHRALLGLTLHTFFDGVAIASGFLVSARLSQAGAPLCTDCARIDRVQQIQVICERKADSPIYWKR